MRSSVERLVLRRVVSLGAPLALALLEIFHPERPSSASETVEQGGWFMWFHFIQLPLIGLIALAVYLLTDGEVGWRKIRPRQGGCGVHRTGAKRLVSF
jgi:hypothetical protein